MNDSVPQDTPTKQCTKCKQWKLLTPEFFHVRTECKGGFTSHCKQCRNDKQRKPPKSEPVPEGQKRCTKCNAVYSATSEYFHLSASKKGGLRAWCKTCRSTYEKRDKEYSQHYGKTHREAYNAAGRRFYASHKEEHRVYSQHYLITHREQCRTVLRNRAARQKAAQGKHTAQDVQVQLQRQKGKCYYCQKKLDKYHVDHVVPIIRGGSNDISNLVIACPTCNLKKNKKLPHEWPEGGRLM